MSKFDLNIFDLTAFGDTNKSWLVGTMRSSASTTTHPVWYDSGTQEYMALDPLDGVRRTITALEASKVKAFADGLAEGSALPEPRESDVAWLKRRVKEVCWSPT